MNELCGAREIQPKAECMLDYNSAVGCATAMDLAQPIVLTEGPSTQPGLELPSQNGLVLKF